MVWISKGMVKKIYIYIGIGLGLQRLVDFNRFVEKPLMLKG